MPLLVAPDIPANALKASLHPPYLSLPVYGGKVSAAQSRWASAAQDYMDDDTGVLGGRLDLNERFVANPPSTFLMPVEGESMIGIGIMPGMIAIVDKNADVRSGSIVVVWYGDKYIVKQLYIKGNTVKLRSKHPNLRKYRPILFKGEDVLVIWGVVRHGINSY
jgi:DNA polymerase V